MRVAYSRFNKRAYAPIAFLVPLTLVLVIISVFGFITFDKNISDSSKAISDMISEKDFGYLYIINSAALFGKQSVVGNTIDIKSKFQEFAANKDFRIYATGNFFGKVRNGDFKFDRLGNGYKLSFKDLFVQASRLPNRIKNNFNLDIEFNTDGKVQKIMTQSS